MVAHSIMRTYGVNQEFRFDEGIWLYRKSGQIRFFFGKYLLLHPLDGVLRNPRAHGTYIK